MARRLEIKIRRMKNSSEGEDENGYVDPLS